MGRAADLLKFHAEQVVLKALKGSGGEGNLEAAAESLRKLTEQKEQLVEVELHFLPYTLGGASVCVSTSQGGMEYSSRFCIHGL